MSDKTQPLFSPAMEISVERCRVYTDADSVEIGSACFGYENRNGLDFSMTVETQELASFLRRAQSEREKIHFEYFSGGRKHRFQAITYGVQEILDENESPFYTSAFSLNSRIESLD